MRSVAADRQYALAEVDAAADAAQRRFRGGVPDVKIVQARAYVAARAADPQAPVPPYVALEAQLRAVGPLVLATAIAEAAELLDTVIGPQLERERIAGRMAVADAQGADDEARRAAIDAAREAAVATIYATAAALMQQHTRFRALVR